MTRRVVITGLGAVGSFGCGRAALAAALANGAPRREEVQRPDGLHGTRSARTAALVGGLDLTALVPPAAARRMSPPSRFAVAAGRLALDDAGLESRALESAATVLATSFGPTSFTEKLLRQILLEGPAAASPSLFTECVANAPAAQVAIALGIRGPNISITQREAGPLTAMARGAALVAAGRADAALVGAAEEMSPLLHAVLDRFRALARPRGREGEVARPFDRRRDGFLAADGAAVAVLETEDAAARRSARPLARIAAWGAAFDCTASQTDWGVGSAGLGEALYGLLGRNGLSPEAIELVVAGASGAVAGDRLEALTLRAAWAGHPLPPVLAPKATTGEYGGAALAAAVLAMAGSSFGPTHGFAQPDPALGIAPHDGRPLPRPRRALVSALAAGGAAGWLVLEQP